MATPYLYEYDLALWSLPAAVLGARLWNGEGRGLDWPAFLLLALLPPAIFYMGTFVVNVSVVGVLALTLASKLPWNPPEPAAAEAPVASASSGRSILVAVGLSGLTALGAEVVWTRTFALLFGASVYTFSLILAVFLTGLAAGSCACS